MDDSARRFDAFVRDHGDRIRRALVAAYGPHPGSDAAQAALSYGWEHWERVGSMENPAGYLYRVGQSAVQDVAKSERRRSLHLLASEEPYQAPMYEPGLPDALGRLTDSQRAAVVLVHGHGYRLADVAELLDVSVSTLRNHLRRGLDKLRHDLGAEHACN